jgi:ABC-type nickel/cobalt efflux system permease component RcnA
VGISGGALPCPSALVVLLSAISLHRVGFGLILIISFSLGLAAVLTSIGLLLLYASKWSQKFQSRGSIRYALPVVSSLVITILGCIIAVQSILQI